MKRLRTAHFQRGLVLLLLLVLYAQLMGGIRVLSLTYDEPIYIGVGYSDWAAGDPYWHGHIGHPPLVNLLTAWPLMLDPARPDPRSFAQWGSSDVLGFAHALIPHLGLERATVLTRIPVIWITLLLAALVYRWACEVWHGRAAGLLALTLLTFDPTVLAHGRLNSTDMGIAAFGFLTGYMLARYLRDPAWMWRIAVGIAAGMAFSSKASGPYYLGMAGLLLLIWGLVAWRKSAWWRDVILTGILWVGLALGVLWATYLFEVQPLHPGGVPVPAASHWRGLPYINEYMQSGQTTYFRGNLYSENHPWQYFFVAFLIKTPLPTLIVLTLALTDIVRHLWKQTAPRISDLLVLASVPLGYFLVAVILALQIGQRHLLPMFPFLFVLCGGLAVCQYRWPKVSRGLAVLLIGWLIWGTLAVQPFELSYFNALAGGQGHTILADSSVDWGQAFKAARPYVDALPEPPYLAAFASVDPAIYGLDFEPLPPTYHAPLFLPHLFNPDPGVYLISATPLHGLWLLDPDTYSWFRQREPDAQLGGAIFAYHVIPPQDPPTWVVQCADPLPPLSPEQIASGFGRSDLRIAWLDCAQSWVYPADGAGWYVLPGDGPPDAWAAQHLRAARLTYTRRDHWTYPALRIYLQEAPDINLLPSGMPVATDGPLTFLGYVLEADQHAPGDALALQTFWRVETSASRPLSLLAHLVGPEGTGVAVGDGLGFPIEQWRPGDVIVQRHVLTPPSDAPPGTYTVITGGYWLDTLERWRLQDESGVHDQIILTQLTLSP